MFACNLGEHGCEVRRLDQVGDPSLRIPEFDAQQRPVTAQQFGRFIAPARRCRVLPEQVLQTMEVTTGNLPGAHCDIGGDLIGLLLQA